jgi:integrase/recombinase XerD
VAEAQVLGAVASLSMLSPIEHEVGKYSNYDLPKNEKPQQLVERKPLRQPKKKR